jgi:hypothetical protein
LTCVLVAASLGAASPRHAAKAQLAASLVVHEWGTFTSIAGADGEALQWLPFSTKSDLPTFVEHYANTNFKAGLGGTVRMETPVIYFYSPQETTVSVHVSFAKGLITEWYPRATGIQPKESHSLVMLSPRASGSISWDSVSIAPALQANFPTETTHSHYYAARETGASPLSVRTLAGEQHEKFLFYRGVSAFTPPVSGKVLNAERLQLQNRAAQPIPALILFERRGDRLGYRILSVFESSAMMETPSTSGTLDSLRADLEDLLVAQGLYRDEARAMLETWRDSWFEEGSRLFYVVPRSFLDSVLPLSIEPTPGQLVRAFVGRIELITPATKEAVEAALLSRDYAILDKYSRFLAAIVNAIAGDADSARSARLQEALSAYNTHFFATAVPKAPRDER